jgi:cell division protein FtsL
MNEARLLIQAYAEAPWRKQTQVVLWFSLAVVSISFILGLYLNVSASATATGREIQSMQRTINRVQRENADLESQLAILSSAREIEKRAQELNLQPAQPDQLVYIAVPGYTPRQPASFAPPPGMRAVHVPGIAPEYSQSLVEWLQVKYDQLDVAELLVEAIKR